MIRENQLLIGVVGKIGAGKDTFSDYYTNYMAQRHGLVVQPIRSSQILEGILLANSLPLKRENYAAASQKIQDEGRLDWMFDSTLGLITPDNLAAADIILFNGVRYLEHLERIRDIYHGANVYLRTDSDEVRYLRKKGTPEKPGEKDMSRRHFRSLEKDHQEIIIPTLAHLCDFEVDNNGTVRHLQWNIRTFSDASAGLLEQRRQKLAD